MTVPGFFSCGTFTVGDMVINFRELDTVFDCLEGQHKSSQMCCPTQAPYTPFLGIWLVYEYPLVFQDASTS